ncbi:MAG: Fpg/Nei family DNA glycosylase [Vicinamibacterales bacterium]
MPEGDTIFRAAAALQRALAGRVVTGFDTALAQLSRVHDDTPVTGRTIERCESMGKHLLIWFSGHLALRTHMRMSGSWHIYRPGEAWQRPARAMRVRIDTDAWVAVAFDVPVAEFLHARDLPRSRALAPLGPDLLSRAFDRGEALRRLAGAGDRPIAEALLDQRVVAGIGNIFKSEGLFLAGIHPDRPASSLADEERAAILDIAGRLLRANTGSGPHGPIVTYRSLRQMTGRASPEEGVWVYGRRGKPCRRCGTPIEGAKRGADARATYWCPRCQRR